MNGSRSFLKYFDTLLTATMSYDLFSSADPLEPLEPFDTLPELLGPLPPWKADKPPHKRAAYQKEYKTKNASKLRAQFREYVLRNPTKMAVYRETYKTRKQARKAALKQACELDEKKLTSKQKRSEYDRKRYQALKLKRKQECSA